MLRPLRAAAAVLIAIFAAGCSTTPGRTLPDDRWEGLNRKVYKFNDTVDRAALKPVAKGYRKITPHWMRIGIGNFLGNLEYPATMVNQFLQGKPKLGLRDTGRFLLNSTLGVAGVFDVATAVGLEANDEDLGQTLAVWGVGSGPFVNLPFFGPSLAARRADAHRRFLLRSARRTSTRPGKWCGVSARSTLCIRAPSCCRWTRRCSGRTTRTPSSVTRGSSSASSRSSTAIRRPRRSEDFEDEEPQPTPDAPAQ